MTRRGTVRIGISGWTYAGWRGIFYPEELPHKRELAYAAGKFPTVEINGSFYSLQTPASFGKWSDATPEDFIFAVKGSRYITHMRRLRDIEKPLANFLASGLLRLGPKLGPILWQFPPNFRYERERLESFFALLPRDTKAAAEMARRHDSRVKGRAWTEIDRKRPLRHTIEIRHDSFRDPDFIRLLRAHKIALCCADTVEWPRLMDLTADFIYCRLHGSIELYKSGYGEASLRKWAARVDTWSRGEEPADAERVIDKPAPKRARRDVYLYFDNDAKVRAPFDAQRLIRLVRKVQER
jgi:uncharacterized protein YecE (DUF72 family)